MRKHALIKNTLLLTLTSFILRLTGVAFNAFLTRRMGAAGLGVLQLVMTAYAFGITLATSGVRLATTRLVVEAKDRSSQRQALRFCLRWSFALGLLVSVGLFFSAGALCRSWLDCPEAAPALQLLALGLPFVARSSVFSGYFTATGRIVRQAAVQLGEQGVQIAVTVSLLSLWKGAGVMETCVAVAGGISISEAVSCLAYRLFCRLGRSSGASEKLTRRFLRIALPDASGALIGSALRTAQGLLIPATLRLSGAGTDAALTAYGVISGMVMPLLLSPSALLWSFSTLLLPQVADAHAKGRGLRMSSLSTRSLQLSVLFSIGVAGFFLAFAGPLSRLLFPDADVSAMLRLFASLLPLLYLDIVVDSLLKGLDQQVWSMGFNVLDSALGVVLICLLIPRYGVAGYVATIFLTRVLNACLSLLHLVRTERFPYDLWRGLLLPGLCAAASLFALYRSDLVWARSTSHQLALAVLLYLSVYLLPQWSSLRRIAASGR